MALDKDKVTKEMIEVVADFVGMDPGEVELDKKLILEYGISSIEASELIMEMEDRYSLKIPIEEAVKILSTQQAIDYVIANG